MKILSAAIISLRGEASLVGVLLCRDIRHRQPLLPRRSTRLPLVRATLVGTWPIKSQTSELNGTIAIIHRTQNTDCPQTHVPREGIRCPRCHRRMPALVEVETDGTMSGYCDSGLETSIRGATLGRVPPPGLRSIGGPVVDRGRVPVLISCAVTDFIPFQMPGIDQCLLITGFGGCCWVGLDTHGRKIKTQHVRILRKSQPGYPRWGT